MNTKHAEPFTQRTESIPQEPCTEPPAGGPPRNSPGPQEEGTQPRWERPPPTLPAGLWEAGEGKQSHVKALPTLPFSRGRGGTGWKGWRGERSQFPALLPKPREVPKSQEQGWARGKEATSPSPRPAVQSREEPGTRAALRVPLPTGRGRDRGWATAREKTRVLPALPPAPASPGLDTSPSHSPFRILSWWRVSCRCRLRTSLRALQQRKRGGGSSGTSSTVHWLVDLRPGSCSP